ncbi:MAG: carotenoid biosynthesis protein [Armatimonadetes bacterium]|nr:carotenoid biosynthesis protein [Armatimonadota bacterium]
MLAEERVSGWTKSFIGLILFSLLGSVLSAFLKLDPGPIKPIASVATLLVGCIALFAPFATDRGFVVAFRAFLALVLLGAAVEICSLYTGYPFGKYIYTHAWVPVVELPREQLFPVLLPVAWAMVTAACYQLCCRFLSGAVAAVSAGFIAVLVDLPMEYTMTKVLGYWHWVEPNFPIGELAFGVPLLNSVGWFLTATAGSFMLGSMRYGEVIAQKNAKLVLGSFLLFVIGLAGIAALAGTR